MNNNEFENITIEPIDYNFIISFLEGNNLVENLDEKRIRFFYFF